MPKKNTKQNKNNRLKWRNRGWMPHFEIGDIHLRELTPYDAARHKQLCETSAGYLGNYLGWAESAHQWSMKAHLQWLAIHSRSKDPFNSFGAFYGDRLLGFFTYANAKDFLGVQICYYVDQECAGRGIATLVTETMVDRAFILGGFEYVELHIDIDNIASQKVAEKVGFTPVVSYSCPKSGKKGTGKMEVWVKLNPKGKSGVTLDDFRNDDNSYLIPAYINHRNALAAAKAITEVVKMIQNIASSGFLSK